MVQVWKKKKREKTLQTINLKLSYQMETCFEPFNDRPKRDGKKTTTVSVYLVDSARIYFFFHSFYFD